MVSWTHIDQHLAIACSWVITWCHGRPSINWQYAGRLLRLNTTMWPTLLLKWCGSGNFWII